MQRLAIAQRFGIAPCTRSGPCRKKTVTLMVFSLVRAAAKKWRRLNGANQLPRAIEGVKFTNGVADCDPAKTNAA